MPQKNSLETKAVITNIEKNKPLDLDTGYLKHFQEKLSHFMELVLILAMISASACEVFDREEDKQFEDEDISEENIEIQESSEMEVHNFIYNLGTKSEFLKDHRLRKEFSIDQLPVFIADIEDVLSVISSGIEQNEYFFKSDEFLILKNRVSRSQGAAKERVESELNMEIKKFPRIYGLLNILNETEGLLETFDRLKLLKENEFDLKIKEHLENTENTKDAYSALKNEIHEALRYKERSNYFIENLLKMYVLNSILDYSIYRLNSAKLDLHSFIKLTKKITDDLLELERKYKSYLNKRLYCDDCAEDVAQLIKEMEDYILSIELRLTELMKISSNLEKFYLDLEQSEVMINGKKELLLQKVNEYEKDIEVF